MAEIQSAPQNSMQYPIILGPDLSLCTGEGEHQSGDVQKLLPEHPCLLIGSLLIWPF